MLINPETGKPLEFHETVQLILVEEHSRTPEEAKKLVSSYPDIIVAGIMNGMNFRATAIALEMKETEDE
jgi:hypothetical protein